VNKYNPGYHFEDAPEVISNLNLKLTGGNFYASSKKTESFRDGSDDSIPLCMLSTRPTSELHGCWG
jgi:hypothetical protein